MKHEMSFKLLSDYLDNRCAGAERSDVEAHLTRCEACRKTLLLLKNIDMTLKNTDSPYVSRSFDAGFEKKLYERMKLKEERRLDYVMANIFERLKDALAMPRPVLARITTGAFLFAVCAYGLFIYSSGGEELLTLAKGDITVYSSTTRSWKRPAAGIKLAKGDILNAGKNSVADISRQGRYTIRVKSSSQILVAKLLPRYVKGIAEYRLIRGKAFVFIDKGFHGSKFIMRTPEAAATALGTEFLADVSVGVVNMSRFGVLNGAVKVESLYMPRIDAKSKEVVVSGGEATEVYKGSAPTTPRRLLEKEWQEMAEFYRIDKKAQVALLVSNGKYRTRELLRPCPIYIADVKPLTLAESLEDTIKVIDEAIKDKDRAKHLDGIRRLGDILVKHPNPDYEPQFLLFIGAYYNYLNMPEDAIRSFTKVADNYPKSTFASMALYASGIIYQEKLKDREKAKRCYDLVLKKYPNSPEAAILK